ncbi:TetR/AcrR family transcriptional regulator [Brevibacillus sp. GCM10020057]|uniref:TetR/AcrR family transcriptional regulator n=1 Tax=Brevibacillus sp. GCM10020057 TaxID=3317327 RepID=UPI00362EC9E1
MLRTRQLIREAFRDLLHSTGFDAITIKDIAQKATVNRATFYAHFEDKYALLDEVTTEDFPVNTRVSVAVIDILFNAYIHYLHHFLSKC